MFESSTILVFIIINNKTKLILIIHIYIFTKDNFKIFNKDYLKKKKIFK